MKLFGKKKEKGKGDVPIDKVRGLTQQGTADKEIIKKLKSDGYSYDEIEKAMLQVVKEGVSLPQPAPTPPAKEPVAAPVPPPQEPLPTWDDVDAPQKTEEDIFDDVDEEDINPELAIEELVEGIINEKWDRFEKRLEEVEKNFQRLTVLVKQFKHAPEAVQTPSVGEEELRDAQAQIEDLDARIGGLEKAFKQFLPSLTRNIESLSNMVHEMKQK